MKKGKVYSAEVNGVFAQLKAYKKLNAVNRFKQLDPKIKASNVYLSANQNSHQDCVENIYPDICN